MRRCWLIYRLARQVTALSLRVFVRHFSDESSAQDLKCTDSPIEAWNLTETVCGHKPRDASRVEIVTSATLLPLTTLFYVLRLCFRRPFTKLAGADDYIMAIAMVRVCPEPYHRLPNSLC